MTLLYITMSSSADVSTTAVAPTTAEGSIKCPNLTSEARSSEHE